MFYSFWQYVGVKHVTDLFTQASFHACPGGTDLLWHACSHVDGM